jgi:hypothetical protein
MSKKVEYYQLVQDHGQTHGVQWPIGSGVYAAKSEMYRVIETATHSYVLFSTDGQTTMLQAELFIQKLIGGGLTCVLVDLQSASNPISQRKPAMNKARRK